jgi:hypothetical protein
MVGACSILEPKLNFYPGRKFMFTRNALALLIKKRFVLALLAGLGMSGAAQATLMDHGGGMIYDNDLNITWLQDANYAMTSGYDADGRMTWYNAVTWASNLSYGGFNDWRLPTTPQLDPTCDHQYDFNSDGVVDHSGGNGCTGSEMGHLFNTEGITFTTPGLFTNMVKDDYWSGTDQGSLAPDFAWESYAGSGSQAGSPKDDGYPYPPSESYLFAWAVRDGDVSSPSSVPEPSTLFLLGSGMVGLIALRRKFRPD